jgi:hypothetical protein
MKHGGFSKTALFPWEDQTDFEALRDSLREEWQPSGALEEDAVLTMLTCIWRKQRIRDKREFDTLAALQEKEFVDLTAQPEPLFDTQHEQTMHALRNRPASSGKRVGDRVSDLLGFSASLYRQLDGQFLELMISMMDKEFSTHLRQEVPKENYPRTAEWVVALKHEVDNVLLPRIRDEIGSPANLAAKAAAFLTPDRIIADLTLEERLDAMIDRAMRRLAQSKMMKEVSGLKTEYRRRSLLPTAPLRITGPEQKAS